jgi:hypothetical protein
MVLIDAGVQTRLIAENLATPVAGEALARFGEVEKTLGYFTALSPDQDQRVLPVHERGRGDVPGPAGDDAQRA